ncbi:acyltransferase [Chromobacterium sp. IIBBL 290-4]|uniref:acyltransferase family protein n=1 Tax=Chromobacterium sp. IIBBL 290-4 TaxID=2953890 RepID=UPI0020B6C1FA|nr:acyltransferase [Chromobacterium sp. IIBBL 290-4]UTH76654.1 acyltransferase [Chromobacterium sp. IIBBL 290-4]
MRDFRRDAKIDVIRGVSILLVLFHHFNIAYRLKDTSLAAGLGWDAVKAVARNGNYGVTMFFVVSGFLITRNALRRWGSLERVDAAMFYGLRVARILPCLALLLVLVNGLAAAGVPIFQSHTEAGAPFPYWVVNLASLTFWMNVLIAAQGWVNYPLGVLWSLSVEEVFYLAFPLLCLLLKRESRLLVFWLLIALIGPAYRWMHAGDEGGYLYAYFASFDGIAIGCLTAVLAERGYLRRLAHPAIQTMVVAAMALLYLKWPIHDSHIWGVSLMALGTAGLLAGVGEERSGGRWGAPMAWLGRHSYELYLFHLITLGLLRTAYPPKLTLGDDKLILLAAYLALSILTAVIVARGYAEPLNRLVRRAWARRLGERPARLAGADAVD